MLSDMEEKDKLKQDILTLGNAFIEDFQERITQVGILSTSLDQKIIYSISGTVTNTEPAVSAAPKLTSL